MASLASSPAVAARPGVSVPAVRFLGRDLTASIVVFLVAMPLCMGIAIASGVPAEKGLITGIEATSRELDGVFQRNGIVRVEAMGQPLDPNRHQAMVEIPSDAEPGTIVQEMQAGYMIKDRLLRPALVGVAKAG